MIDTQYITNLDLKEFGKELVIEIKKELKKDIEETGAHYYGLIHEDLKDTFKANRQWLMDVPEKVSKLSTKAEENDEEHRDFRARLRLLEQG